MSYPALTTQGTISVAANGLVVTGQGTAWLTTLTEFGRIKVGTFEAIVEEVVDDFTLNLAEPWPGPELVESPFIGQAWRDGGALLVGFVNLMERLVDKGLGLADVGVPDNADGRDNDIRFDALTGITYWKVAGTWIAAGLNFRFDFYSSDGPRSDFDDEAPGKTWFDEALELWYVRSTPTPGTWAGPFRFQGPQGNPGPRGYLAGIRFAFAASTANADPGPGLIRANNANLALATELYVDDLDADGNDQSPRMVEWGAVANANRKGTLTLGRQADGVQIVFRLTSVIDEAGYVRLGVQRITGATALAAADALSLQFERAGNDGAKGDPGPTLALLWGYDADTADGDPGAGVFRFNHADPELVTQLYISELEDGGEDVGDWLNRLDQSTTPGDKGELSIVDPAAPATRWQRVKVTGTVVMAPATYRKVPVVWVAGPGGFVEQETPLAVNFQRSGDKGLDGSGAVNSVFGRAGAVVAAAGDYDAPEIAYDSTGDDVIEDTTTDVGQALKDLDAAAALANDAIDDKIDAALLTTQGDIIVRGATVPERLGKGATGQVLTANATTAAWATPAVTNTSRIEKDIRRLAMSDAEQNGYRGNLTNGIVDSFGLETTIDGVDGAGSTNEIYDAAGDYYHPTPTSAPIPGATGTAIGNMTSAGGLPAAFDGVTSSTAGTSAQRSGTSAYIGKTYSTPKKIFGVDVHGANNNGYVSSINPTVTIEVYGKTGAAPANGTDGTLLATLSFADTADESAARNILSGNFSAWDHAWISLTHNGASNAINVAELILHELTGFSAMDLRSIAFPAAVQPNTALLHFQVQPIDAITINVDLKGWVSRTGGSTWTEATLVEIGTLSDGTKIYEAENINISGAPAGTSMKWRLTTHNGKNLRAHGAMLLWA